jgi:hypothetical protein
MSCVAESWRCGEESKTRLSFEAIHCADFVFGCNACQLISPRVRRELTMAGWLAGQNTRT